MKKLLSCYLLFIFIIIMAGCQSRLPAPVEQTPPPASTTEPAEIKTTSPAPVTATTPVKETSTPQVKSLSWWFTRNSQHQPTTINKEAAQLLAENNGFYLLPNNSKKIYLTFDCGYELGNTPKILDILDRKQVKVAFFITGQFIQTQPELVKRMQSSGHLVCNHTWNHPDLTTISQDKFNQEITSLEQKFTALTGGQMAHYLRPPMGNYSSTSLKWAKDLGYASVFWSMAFDDWDPNKQPGADYSYKHVTDNIHPGAVILLHVVSTSDTEALEKIITDLQSQGYVFSTFKG